MRCRQSRRQLKVAFDAGQRIDNDLLLMAHLRQCPQCSRIARPLLDFGGDLAIAAWDDLEGGLPLERLRSLVESRAARRSPQPKEQSIMARFMHGVSRRPRVGLGVAAVAAVVALALLIPLKIQDNTLGYEVAFAGVDKSVAMDTQKIKELLVRLGVDGAEVDLGDCEETCKLRVKQIKSADQAYLVLTAFNDFAHAELQGDVVELKGDKDGRVWKVALKASELENCATLTREDCQVIITECLGDNADIKRFICVSLDSAGRACLDGDSITMSGGHIRMFNGDHMDLNDSTLRELEAQGYRVKRITGDSAGQSLMILNVTRDAGGKATLKVGEMAPSTADANAAAKTEPALPDGFVLGQNYPNPFNPNTTISFSLPSAGEARLEVYNVQGRLVKTLVEGQLEAGVHQVVWDGTDASGSQVATGVYMYRLTAGDRVETRKMSLVK